MPKPKVQILVDWNDDGDFVDANDDITSDVMDFSLDRLRDLGSEYMNATRVSMVLENNGHLYSPPNTGGALSGNLKPGRQMWVRLWYPFDTFTGSAGVQLSSHTPEEDAGWAWVEDLQAMDLDGSGAAQTDSTQGNGDVIATMEFSDADVTIAATINRNSTDTTDHPGLCVRYVDSSNYAYIRVNDVDASNVTIELRKVIAGTDTQVAISGNVAWARNASFLLWVQIHGTAFRVFVSRTEVSTVPGGWTLDDAAINAGTKHGLFCDDEATHTWLDFGGFRSLFYGKLASINPVPKAKVCNIGAYDEFEYFNRDKLTTFNAGSDNEKSDESLGLILDSVGFATADRHLEAGTVLMVDLDVGAKALVDLALPTIWRLQDEEDGLIYVDGLGFVILENRTHRTSAPHTTSKATYKDTYDGSNPAFTDLTWDDGHEYVENLIRVKYRVAVKSGTVVLWKSDQALDTSVAIPIGASETMNFLVETQDYDAAFSWVTPVSTTDYTVNTSADGTGTDKTAQVTVSYQNTSTVLGKFHHLRVVNNDASAYFITKLQTRGVGLTYEDETTMEASDTTSQSAYGERRKVIECLFIDREQAAQDLADNREDRRDDPKTVIEITLAAGDKVTLHDMIQRRISDRVTVDYSDMTINEDFFVEGESWTISEGGTVVEQQLLLRGV